MLELYHHNFSVCAQKVRITLAEKNLPWTNHHVSLTKGEHLSPEFKKLNERGLVHVLVHDGNIIKGRARKNFWLITQAFH